MRLSGKKAPPLDDGTEEGISLIPEEPEDMWHINNLIGPEDVIQASAVRKVVTETKTGSTHSDRVHTTLTIRVESTFYDPAISHLAVKGRVIKENSYVNLGQFHTLDLELHRAFVIWKAHGWDSVAEQTLREALTKDKDHAVPAVVMQEGLANVCLITNYQTLLRQKVEASIPKKLSSSSDRDRGMEKFYDKTLTALLREVAFDEPRPLLVASPGFYAENFKKYIAEKAARSGDKKLRQVAKDAVVIHTSSGHLHALREALQSGEVKELMADKKFVNETRYMDELTKLLKNEDYRAWYGLKPVQKAVAEGAVGRGGGVLLVLNSLFRSLDLQKRRMYVALVDKVKQDGGEARILSSDHESGKRLEGLGGIAAILTYPFPELDQEWEDSDEEQVDVRKVAEQTGDLVI